MTKLALSEELHNQTPKQPQLLALCIRYWLEYKLTGDLKLLNKANHRLITDNDWSIETQFCAAFLEAELELYDNALEILERLGGYRNYFKSNNPMAYGAYLFLQARINARSGKSRAALKYFRLLSDFSQKAVPNPAYILMLGWLRSDGIDGNSIPVWTYLSQSYTGGCRSVFLFERVYRCLAEDNVANISDDSSGKLLIAFIKWSISQRLDIGEILNGYVDAILSAIDGNLEILETIYDAYPDERILTSICVKYISHSDYSETSYRYFHDAETKQLDVPLLQQTLIYSGFHGNREEIGKYTMEQFLQSGFQECDERLKAYVYHVMLTSKRMRDFIPEHSTDILQFTAYCLENGLVGRYYNSLYRNLLENENECAQELISKATNILLGDIFTYQVTVIDPTIRHIWIIEKEKREIPSYEVHDCEAVVKATSETFAYICFSDGVKHIIDEKIKITKMVENADIWLYMRLYTQGHKQPEILIALARHYLSQDELPEAAVGVLEAASKVKGVSVAFLMQLCARLGNYYYDCGETLSSLAYYRDVDENYLNDKYIERMLTVFINTDEYQKAAWLVAKKSDSISDIILFQALKKIARAAPECAEHIAPAAYHLLLELWYDKTLIDVVIKHYKGAQSEWEELSKVLNQLSAPDRSLDDKILYNAIWIRKPNPEAQRVFTRCYRSNPEHELVGMFAYYLSYEMLVNNMRPEYDTIGVLESIFRKNFDSLLGYALSNIYLAHGVATLHSDEVLSRTLGCMELEGFILPVFKQSQDKKLRTPYIEKYQTFIYKALPDKDVRLYYRVDSEAEYRCRQMEYLRFGIYWAIVPHFYGEKLKYYFSEEMQTGSITTKEYEIDNNHVYLDETQADQYYAINNALIYANMFKYEKVEEIITESLREVRAVRAKLL